MEETIETDAAEDNPVARQRPFPPELASDPEPEEPEEAAGFSEPAARASWQSRREHFADAISTLSEPQAMTYDAAPAEVEEEEDADHSSWQNFDEEEPEAPVTGLDHYAGRTEAGDFGLSAEMPAQDGEEEAAEMAEPEEAADNWAVRMKRPWREIVEASRMSAEENDEDAETAIRHALKTALENPSEPVPAPGPFMDQLRDERENHPRGDAGWDPFAPREMPPQQSFSKSQAETEDEDITEYEAEEDAEAADHPLFTVPRHDLDEEDEEAPFKLSGLSGKNPVYQSEYGAEREAGEQSAAHRDAAFQHEIEDAFRAAPLATRTFEPGKGRHDESLTDFDRLFDAQGESDQPGEGYYSEDGAAALQAELESTDLAAYEKRRGGGGLAMAAAWAVFFSIISGIALAAVTLRSEIMAALPRTASLYRAIGFDAAGTGIDFADVSYRWTEAQGKPMIEVKGQVVNITDRRLTVPRVLINVRDRDSSDAVKVTASVPTESLAPRESASFTLEFVSPPKNISQIELEFDRNR